MTLEQALSIAYAQLNRRERTVHEMRRHLVRRGAEPEVAESALLELIDQGYLDDARFAQVFVQDKRELNQWGTPRIRRALVERGVSGDLVDVALSDAGAASDGAQAAPHEACDEQGRAVALLQRRFPAGLADRRDWDRALGMLLRKGYEYELAVDALRAHRRLGSPA